MGRTVHVFAAVTVVLAAHALSLTSLGCGQTCTCHGDVCVNCDGTTPTAISDAGVAAIGDATTERAVLDAPGDGAASLNSDGGPVGVDAVAGHDAGGASEGGAECITGCSRSATSCAAPDPPVQWTCVGPGTTSGASFLEAGCTSVPINAIAWCCPESFLSKCVCTPGQDWTCNDDPAISSIHGMCLPNHSCTCTMGFALNPATGRCK
ncbi:MAG TPA: hypothetical protein VKU41_23435 [Polyangiaceae bacterium]|nr:hypothetical protein [Polyangiaceae bacterium]